jgi:uncharacterized protein (DUF1697 family)
MEKQKLMNQNATHTLAGFLRGINVSGHHKVPMAELRQILTDMGFTNVKTLLNSGNIVFDGAEHDIQQLEEKLETKLNQVFNFKIPLILITKTALNELIQLNPFEEIKMHQELRLYVSLLKKTPQVTFNLPYISNDKGFTIISIHNNIICSMLDLSKTKTPAGMKVLENHFGKNITTRNWNTILKMAEL